MRVVAAIVISDDERETLKRWARGRHYNQYRPHGSLGYQPPTQFAAACAASAPAAPTLQQHTQTQEALDAPQPVPA